MFRYLVMRRFLDGFVTRLVRPGPICMVSMIHLKAAPFLLRVKLPLRLK